MFRLRSNRPDRLRHRMVEHQLRARGIRDEAVLRAFNTIPRHLFMPSATLREAYADRPFPIGHEQTISQPYVVAVMLELLRLKPGETVLEVGAGSGYVTALLGRIVERAIGIERIPALAKIGGERLRRLGYRNCEIHCADGTLGLPYKAPYDAILVSASAREVPPSLVGQLHRDHGRMIIPVGPPTGQRIVQVRYENGEARRTEEAGCVFVRLIGAEGDPDPTE